MHKRTILLLIGVLLTLALIPDRPVQAAPHLQGTIALKNAGFEEGTTNGWGWWHVPETIGPDINQSWYNPFFVPNRDPKRVHSGAQALEMNNEYRKWRGGVYQTVDAAPGTRLVFKVWVMGYTKSGQLMLARAGIDPNGSTNPDNAVWSGTTSVGETYVQLSSPEVTVGPGGKATVFTWAEPPYPDTKTAIFFDDATVTVIGQAQPTGAPTSPPPTAPPARVVTPAQPQPDGSIIYVVQAGDTLYAIALAHNTTVEKIMQLNGLSDTLISVGQRLLVRGPTVPPTATVPPPPVASPTPVPTPVPPTGQICISAFNDRDGDGQPGGTGEDLLPGVVFALSSPQSTPKNYTTDGMNEPYCFTDLAPDTFTLKIVPPTGYSATTPEVWTLSLIGGQKIEVNFGAKRGGPAATATAPKPSPGESGSSFFSGVGRIILIALAAIVLLGLGAAGMYFISMRR